LRVTVEFLLEVDDEEESEDVAAVAEDERLVTDSTVTEGVTTISGLVTEGVTTISGTCWQLGSFPVPVRYCL